jgi:hypothetical protein
MAAVFVLSFFGELHGQVVVGSNIDFASGEDEEFSITSYVVPDRNEVLPYCSPSVCVSYGQFVYQDGSIISGLQNLDFLTQYYLVDAGDALTEGTLAEFDLFDHVPFHVGQDDFYLGMQLLPQLGSPGYYGWIHLQPNGNRLTMLGNAIAYNSLGIIVGTGIAVPEPMNSAAALLFVGALFPKTLLVCHRGRLIEERV